jgi:hypothetical protein
MTKLVVEDESVNIEFRYSGPTLDDVIAKLQEIRKTVPGCAKARAWVSGYDDDEIHVCFEYKREETDKEYDARIQKARWETKRIEDDEKETYRRLKAKFGDVK